ncbi:porin [Rhizobium sp. Root1220]|uniref:porin n=1 Tax=Rhizobium sp. Root1220 TaxID=1736432 RepID=UPI0006FFEBCA|nr:porin [Rhizobium sp. Root1220]KQV81429.1 hypothetical protein ASC90_03665 [Rhizobium sp. Root1220]
MSLRMMLLGCAAAVVAAPSFAADAIVAAEPKAIEYVRVCDAYGTGYFYIPGTETCLKIGGYLRFEVYGGPDENGTSDWNARTRAHVEFIAKSDTEYGPLTGLIVLRNNGDNSSTTTILDSAYIDVAGLRAGLFYSWWDDDLNGEPDVLSSFETLHNSIRYQYETGDFYSGLSVDELEDGYYKLGEEPNNLGIAFGIGDKIGDFSYQVIGGYDTDNEEGAIRGMIFAQLGPGTLGLAGVWASGPNSYYAQSEWTIATEYAIEVTDKWSVTPAAQYFGKYATDTNDGAIPASFEGLGDAWMLGFTTDYHIATDFYLKVTASYLDEEDGDDVTSGFLRLQRAF